MKLHPLAVTVGIIALSVYGAKNWTHGSHAPGQRDSPRAQARRAADLKINLQLGFKGRGQWIAEGEDRKIYLLGNVKNEGGSRVERLVIEALVQDEGSLGGPTSHEITLGPFEPGESQTYEDLVTYLLPKGEDAHGNEVFEFSYELNVLSID